MVVEILLGLLLAALVAIGVILYGIERRLAEWRATWDNLPPIATCSGLVVSDRDRMNDGREIAFMTLDPREHHQVVFATGRPADLAYNMIQQLSFRAESLADLRDMYVALKREPIVELGPISHGNAISAYFRDPEGNRLEVFVDTKWHVPQPCAEPLDLMKSDDEIMAFVDRQIAKLPGVSLRTDWERERTAKF